MSTQSFEEFVESAFACIQEKQDEFMSKYAIDDYESWYYDQEIGVLTFSNGDEDEIYFEFQCIGSFAPEAETWLWSWANKNTYPNVKGASYNIREFGEQNGYEKLTTASWEAEEYDGWEMVAVANAVLNPIGFYRIPTEGILLFTIITKQLTEEEIGEKEINKDTIVECGIHGLFRPAYVCQHLNLEDKLGFNEAFETWEGMELEEGEDLGAWCDECEKVRLKHDGWNEESEKFANIKLVCEDCYFEMKQLNE